MNKCESWDSESSIVNCSLAENSIIQQLNRATTVVLIELLLSSTGSLWCLSQICVEKFK